MSSPRSFEILHEASKRFEDGLIDEDVQDLQRGRNNHVMNRVITTRGRYRGRGVILQYCDFYSDSFSPFAADAFERRLLEVFVSQSSVTFEGTVRACGLLGKLARMFGGGGIKGRHALFERCRVDQTDEGNVACFEVDAFCDGLADLALDPTCVRVKLQAGGGVCPILEFDHVDDVAGVMSWLDRTSELAAALEPRS